MSEVWDFQRIDFDSAPWDDIESCPDHTVFKTRAWMRYILATQSVEPVVLSLGRGGRTAGYFVAAIIKKAGLKILASPFPGWTTSFQGASFIDPEPPWDRGELYAALIRFAFGKLGCVHFECLDMYVGKESLDEAGVPYEMDRNYWIDLSQTEEELFAGFQSRCRGAIRKAKKNGVVVAQPEDPEQFADDYYDQLIDVFAKQGKVPMYPRSRLAALVRHVHPTGNLLLLESRGPDGKCIGTGIFPGFNTLMQYWGGASYRSGQILRPNEILVFEAMNYWRKRGISIFELGGGGTYKEKFGPAFAPRPRIIAPRWRIVKHMKRAARWLVGLKRRIWRGGLK